MSEYSVVAALLRTVLYSITMVFMCFSDHSRNSSAGPGSAARWTRRPHQGGGALPAVSLSQSPPPPVLSAEHEPLMSRFVDSSTRSFFFIFFDPIVAVSSSAPEIHVEYETAARRRSLLTSSRSPSTLEG